MTGARLRVGGAWNLTLRAPGVSRRRDSATASRQLSALGARQCEARVREAPRRPVTRSGGPQGRRGSSHLWQHSAGPSLLSAHLAGVFAAPADRGPRATGAPTPRPARGASHCIGFELANGRRTASDRRTACVAGPRDAESIYRL